MWAREAPRRAPPQCRQPSLRTPQGPCVKQYAKGARVQGRGAQILARGSRARTQAGCPARTRGLQDKKVEITFEDQKSINTFSNLNSKQHDLQGQINVKKVRAQGAELPLCVRSPCAALSMLACCTHGPQRSQPPPLQ